MLTVGSGWGTFSCSGEHVGTDKEGVGREIGGEHVCSRWRGEEFESTIMVLTRWFPNGGTWTCKFYTVLFRVLFLRNKGFQSLVKRFCLWCCHWTHYERNKDFYVKVMTLLILSRSSWLEFRTGNSPSEAHPPNINISINTVPQLSKDQGNLFLVISALILEIALYALFQEYLFSSLPKPTTQQRFRQGPFSVPVLMDTDSPNVNTYINFKEWADHIWRDVWFATWIE